MLTLIMFVSLLTAGNAQFDIDNLFGGANVGYAKPLGDVSEFIKGGLTYNVVLGYKLNENFAVGVEYASAITLAIDTTDGGSIIGGNIYGLRGYYAKAWYKFMEGTFQPYAAVGLGLAQFEEPDWGSTGENQKRTGFGANLELGLAINNFNLSYAFVLGGKAVEESVFVPGLADLSVNYHKFSLGYIYNF